jgi:hypothetical protein
MFLNIVEELDELERNYSSWKLDFPIPIDMSFTNGLDVVKIAEIDALGYILWLRHCDRQVGEL